MHFSINLHIYLSICMSSNCSHTRIFSCLAINQHAHSTNILLNFSYIADQVYENHSLQFFPSIRAARIGGLSVRFPNPWFPPSYPFPGVPTTTPPATPAQHGAGIGRFPPRPPPPAAPPSEGGGLRDLRDGERCTG